jgi:hypothetical protein
LSIIFVSILEKLSSVSTYGTTVVVRVVYILESFSILAASSLLRFQPGGEAAETAVARAARAAAKMENFILDEC